MTAIRLTIVLACLLNWKAVKSKQGSHLPGDRVSSRKMPCPFNLNCKQDNRAPGNTTQKRISLFQAAMKQCNRTGNDALCNPHACRADAALPSNSPGLHRPQSQTSTRTEFGIELVGNSWEKGHCWVLLKKRGNCQKWPKTDRFGNAQCSKWVALTFQPLYMIQTL